MAHPFDRYAAYTDVKALKESSAKPLRKSMRVNLLKSSVTEFKAWAQKKKWMIEPVPWCAEGFFVDRVDREEALGKDLLHILGHTYMQEAASMLPVALLNPQPGDHVLDMSAAPGSKTTQIASQMSSFDCAQDDNFARDDSWAQDDSGGVIVANDVQEKRLWSLSSNLQRCSVMNVLMTRKVGQWFAKNMTGRFDCVLCDAPCTAQGTVRKDSDALSYCSMENTHIMAGLQRELLESAIHAAKIGGRIVYSTCTLTPEENEEVVRSVVEKFAGMVEVVDPRMGLGMGIGLGNWDCTKAIDDSYEVQKSLKSPTQIPTLRLWPQTYDTEGFFSALLIKKAATKERSVTERVRSFQSTILPASRAKAFRNSLERWYGTGFVRDDEVLFQNKENLSITTQEVADFHLPIPAYRAGLPFGKATKEDIVRIAQEMVTLRGREALCQAVHLTEDQLRQLLKGQNIDATDSTLKNGDVMLFLNDVPVCRGLFKDGLVLNRLPREIVQMYA